MQVKPFSPHNLLEGIGISTIEADANNLLSPDEDSD